MLALISAGWRVAIIWECVLRGNPALEQLDRAMNDLVHWVQHPTKGTFLELPALAVERTRDAN